MKQPDVKANPRTELLTSKEFAAKLGICMPTLDTMDKNGELPKHLRIGRNRRWRVADINAWIEGKLAESVEQREDTARR